MKNDVEIDQHFAKVRSAKWHDRARLMLKKQVDNGATIYGYREGQYIARTRDGVRVTKPGLARAEALARANAAE